MTKIKVETKQTKKIDIDIHDFAVAMVEGWNEYELYDFFSSFVAQLSYEGKEDGVIDLMIRNGYKARFQGWIEGKTW